MKITLERSHLLKALNHVQKVVEKRNTYPILANVLIKTGEGEIEMRATDLDIEITESVPANIFAEGTITVSAHKLYEIVRKLTDGAEVRLEAGSDQDVTLTSGRARFKLATLSPETFPDLKSGTFDSKFAIQAAVFKDMLDRTAFAASSEETRYYLNGVHFHTLDQGGETVLRSVATDGHRMARCGIAAPSGANLMPAIIIPRKTVNELQKLLDGVDGEITVEVSATKIRVDLGGIILLSKLIEGTFPDYERVTPKHNDRRMEVNRQELDLAVDRVSTIASDRGGKSVKLSARDGVLELSVSNPDHGAATEEMPASFDGDLQIGFNARYLADIVSQVRADTIVFMFNDSNSPTLILDGATEDTIYVLMPMRV